jgi:hypothetical protein
MPTFQDTGEDDWDEDEPGDGDDSEDADAGLTIPCPYCTCEMFEDSPFCPRCQRYISAEDHPGAGRPLWVTLTALICLGVALWWVFMAFR